MVKNLKRFIEDSCDQYCESMTDQEFNWLVKGLTIKFKEYLKDIVDEL